MGINMNPGIDWEQEQLILRTKSGVLHYPVDNKHVTANCVTVDQQWCGGGYSVAATPTYLSVKFYGLPDHVFDSVGRFKAARAEQRPMHLRALQHYSYWYGNQHHPLPDVDHELRIYRDRTIVMLHKVCVHDVDIVYTSANKYWWAGGMWGPDGQPSADVRVVHSDSEAKQYARQIAKTDTRCGMYQESWSDLANRCITNNNAYQTGHFNSATRATVEKFLQYTGAKNTRIHSIYLKDRCGRVGPDVGINSVRDLLTWCAIDATQSAQAMTKQELAEKLTSLVSEWNNPEQHLNEAIWLRDGDDIVLAIPSMDMTNYYGFGIGCKKIFSYNVKTKKRFYGEQDAYGVWAFPIPSLNYMTTAMYLGARIPRADSGTPITPKTVIQGGLTVQKLFAGTNVGWILENTPKNDCYIKNTDVVPMDGSYRNNSAAVPVDVKEFISNTRIGTVALSILTTTGVPVLEQLLKAQLFNTYFAVLDELAEHSSGYYPTFYDEDKKHANTDTRESACFVYHGKATNLKKMFGIPLTTLRALDASMAWSQDQYNTWERHVPNVVRMTKALGTGVADLDSDTLARALALTKVRGRWGYDIWETIDTELTRVDGIHMSPKQIVSLLETYRDNVQEYKDYLNMRRKLANIHEQLGVNVFSEKQYPIKPSCAKRFIPFLEGIPDRSMWHHQPMTAVRFLEVYKSDFFDANARGDLQVVYDEESLSGILVNLNAVENMKYLHDDASYWISFYQDAAKDALFEGALQRVRDLEWEDPTSGLKIVLPQNVADLRAEGEVLRHCVATYVDPIIGGNENIVFLRRADMPDHPFYTVEVLGNGEIRQVHCYRNGDLTSDGQRRAFADSGYAVYDHDYDVIGFLLKWANAKRGRLKANSVKASYGALCALR